MVNRVRKEPDASTADVAASFQEAVVDVLVTRARRAAADVGARALCLAGGVAANSLLRSRIEAACAEDGIGAFLPSRALCTDNAAMVAAAGYWRLTRGDRSGLDLGADPNLRLVSTAARRPGRAVRRPAGTRGARLPTPCGPGIVSTLNLRLLTPHRRPAS